MDQVTRARETISGFTNVPVSFATITGLDLADCNDNRGKAVTKVIYLEYNENKARHRGQDRLK